MEENAALRLQIAGLNEQAEKLQAETVRVRKDLESSISSLREEKQVMASNLDTVQHQLHSRDDTYVSFFFFFFCFFFFFFFFFFFGDDPSIHPPLLLLLILLLLLLLLLLRLLLRLLLLLVLLVLQLVQFPFHFRILLLRQPLSLSLLLVFILSPLSSSFFLPSLPIPPFTVIVLTPQLPSFPFFFPSSLFPFFFFFLFPFFFFQRHRRGLRFWSLRGSHHEGCCREGRCKEVG